MMGLFLHVVRDNGSNRLRHWISKFRFAFALWGVVCGGMTAPLCLCQSKVLPSWEFFYFRLRKSEMEEARRLQWIGLILLQVSVYFD